MKTVIEAIKFYAQTTPDALCIADIDKEGAMRSCTYSEFWTDAKKGAAALSDKGIKRGHHVAVECTQDGRFLKLEAACAIVGAVFIPVERKASAENVSMITGETAADLFLYENEYRVTCPAESIDSILSYPGNADLEYTLPEPDDTAQILFTTGTTGKSKGIEMTFGANFALAENVKEGVEMKEGNVELLPLPLSHSHGLRCIYANYINGSAVVVMDGVTRVKLVFDLLDAFKVTAMDISPSAARVLLKLSKGKLKDYAGIIDYIQLGTAPLPEDTKQELLTLLPGSRLYNFYGSTESGRSCVLDFSKVNRPNCIGRPSKNARFMVTDDERNEIKSDPENPGLLACAGAMNMKGYYRQEELTRQTMKDGFIFTNDLSYIDEEGYIYVLGRRDDVINYKGIKIAPDEIEAAAMKFPAVKDCACVPKADKMSGQVPKLFVSLNEGMELDKKDLLAFLEDYIDPNKMPKMIEVIDVIPRTSNGKLRRIELRDR